MKQIRLAVISTHPIQYYAPLYREIFSRPGLTGEVLFAGRHGMEAHSFDPEFGQEFKWDIDLTGGYPHRFLDVRARFGQPTSDAVRWYTSVGRELANGGYDAVMIPGYRPLFEMHALSAAFKAGLPVLLRPEGYDREGPHNQVKQTLKAACLRQIYRRVAAYLSIGSRSRQHFVRHGGDESKVFHSPYAVSNDRFADDFALRKPAIQELRRAAGIADGAMVIVFSGKMIPRKRPLTLVRAVARCRAKSGIHVVWAGSGPLMAEVRAACESESLHTSFPGFVNQSDIGRWYAVADLHVLPSAEETWGLVVNETMNYGLPQIVTTGAASGDDLVIGRNTGFVVGVDDADAMAQKIDYLAAHPEERKKMSRAAAEVISGHGIKEAANGIVTAAETVRAR